MGNIALKKFILKVKTLLKDKKYVLFLLSSFLFLGVVYVITYYVSIYNDFYSYDAIKSDLILDKIPTLNLEFIFSWGMLITVGIATVYFFVLKPELAPSVICAYAFLFLTRTFFNIMTHVGPPVDSYFLNNSNLLNLPLENLIFRNDLFFSGHAAIPFLAFLYIRHTGFKAVMFVSTILMSLTVLFMHVHYTIDVFAAFFITYGVFVFNKKLFVKLNRNFKDKLRYVFAEKFNYLVNLNKGREFRGLVDLRKVGQIESEEQTIKISKR